jgi:hypothetical protein
MDVTILKLDLGDAEFNAPFATKSDTESDGDGPTEDEENEAAGATDGGIDPKPVVALVVLAALALVGWYLRSGEDDPGVEADELDIEET